MQHNIYYQEVEHREKLSDVNLNSSQTASPHRAKVDQISFSFEKRCFENISEKDLTEWKILYPSVDISRELLEMSQWCLSNPTKSKSKKLWRKFITNWLSRDNESNINRMSYLQKKSQTFSTHNYVDRRTKNLDGTPVSSPHDGRF